MVHNHAKPLNWIKYHPLHCFAHFDNRGDPIIKHILSFHFHIFHYVLLDNIITYGILEDNFIKLFHIFIMN